MVDELRARLGRGRDAGRGGGGGAAGPRLGGEHLDAGAVAARRTSLATNRQIPSWLGKLGRRWTTPHVAILIAAVISFGLVIPGDVLFLGGLYAFGATIAFTIAHVSLVRLRMTAAGPRPPVPGAVERSLSGRRRARCPRCAGGGADGGRVDQRAALPRRGPVHRGRLDAVRPGRLRGLPGGGRGHVADQAGDGAGRGAGEGRARRAVRRDHGARLRHAARRRHRRHRRPARRRRRHAGGDAAAPGGRLRPRRCR